MNAGSSSVCTQETLGPLLPPTGPSPVGRASLVLTDSSRTMPDSARPRRLMIHVWYPASTTASTTMPYIPDLRPARAVLTNEEVAALESARTHAGEAPFGMRPTSRFPALIFSHGDQMNAFLYSNVHEDLASRGYVVIAVDHPGQALFVTYPDGSAVEYAASGPAPDAPGYAAALSQYLRRRLSEREADLRFVRAHLGDIEVRGRRLRSVLSGRTGAFGHSIGGLAAAALCQAPMVVDACINMDGRLDAAPYLTASGKKPPAKPFLYLTKPIRALTDEELQREGLTREQSTRAEAQTDARDLRLLANAGPPAYRAVVLLADHTTFSDEPLVRDPSDARSRRLMGIVREYVRKFFDSTLSAGSGKRFDMTSDNDVRFTSVAAVRQP